MTFATAVLLYLLPPLSAIALSVIVLAPITGASRKNLCAVLKRRVLGEAVVMAPFGVFLVGMGLSSAGRGLALFGLVVAYVVFRILLWFHWSQSYAAVTPLESGDLFERASLLAKKAGVVLSRLNLLPPGEPGPLEGVKGSPRARRRRARRPASPPTG